MDMGISEYAHIHTQRAWSASCSSHISSSEAEATAYSIFSVPALYEVHSSLLGITQEAQEEYDFEFCMIKLGMFHLCA